MDLSTWEQLDRFRSTKSTTITANALDQEQGVFLVAQEVCFEAIQELAP